MKMKALKRRKGTRQSPAQGLGRVHLDLILTEFGDAPSLLDDLRDAALLSVAYNALLRRGELVALCTEDVKVDADGTGLLYLARSKSDQEGQGSYCWLAPDTVRRLCGWLDARTDALRNASTRLCDDLRILSAAMREGGVLNGQRRKQSLERRLARLEATSGALWLQLDRTGPLAVHGPDPGRRIPEIFRCRAAGAGLDPSLVSGHSLRVVAAQDLTAAGFGLPAIQQAGRWRSPTMPARYGEMLLPKIRAMAQLAGKQGRG